MGIVEKEVAFIICSNNKEYMEECKKYIDRLIVPGGVKISIIVIEQATSMTSGYNRAMKVSDAEYKVYLHQDVFILNHRFIEDFMKCFEADDKLAMLGVSGTKNIPKDANVWESLDTGGGCSIGTFKEIGSRAVRPEIKNPSNIFGIVEFIDGMLMITKKDIAWDERLTGFHFYDVSQCIRFAQAGYKIGVARQETAWCFHDYGPLNLETYNFHKKIFCQLYDGFCIPEENDNDNGDLYRSCDKIAKVLRCLFLKGDFSNVKKVIKEIGEAVYFNNDLLSMLFIIEIRDLEKMYGEEMLYIDGESFELTFDKYQRLRMLLIRSEHFTKGISEIVDNIINESYSIWAIIVLIVHNIINIQEMEEEIGKKLESLGLLNRKEWGECIRIVMEYETEYLPKV